MSTSKSLCAFLRYRRRRKTYVVTPQLAGALLVSTRSDSINMAQRMESSSCAGAIHVSSATRDMLEDEEWEPTGGVEVGGLFALG